MKRVKEPSLASTLGVPDPSNPTAPVAPAPKLSAKQLSRAMLASPQYRESLLRRILMDDLPPQIEVRLWEYAYGKPVEHVEVTTTSTLENLTVDQLEARAMHLAEMARRLRQDEADAAGSGQVH